MFEKEMTHTKSNEHIPHGDIHTKDTFEKFGGRNGNENALMTILLRLSYIFFAVLL